MVDKTAKMRISVTLTQPYIDALNELERTGLYLNQGASIRQALKDLFKKHNITFGPDTYPD